MPVTSEQSAPYAPSSVILALLQRNREKGLPNPVTAEALQRLGVSDSLVPRTLQALKTLDLIGEDGKHTVVFESLRRAPEAEYQNQMAEWLRGAYEHALDVIDPATADEVSIRDAFRHYSPISVQPRMITLFTSLFEAAGVRPPDQPKPALKKVSAPNGTMRIVRHLSRPAPRPVFRPIPPRPSGERQHQSGGGVPGLHPALAGLLSSLPAPDVGWAKADRDRFMEAFGVVLDFAIPHDVKPKIIEDDDGDA